MTCLQSGRTFGEGSAELRTHPLLRGVDLPERQCTLGNSGPLVTKGGLLFPDGGDPDLTRSSPAWGAQRPAGMVCTP